MPVGGVETILQALPIVMTVALLLTLVALLVRARRLAGARRGEASAMPRQSEPPQPPGTGTQADGLPQSATQAMSPRAGQTGDGVTILQESAAAATPQSPAAARSEIDVRRDIARREDAGEASRLAELHMELGELLLAAGRLPDAAAELRRSIISAARLRQHGTHASARLLLGDIAEREGDLTTACEHWQIARSLFQDLKVTGRHKEADARMRRIGCPTDWVLNDF